VFQGERRKKMKMKKTMIQILLIAVMILMGSTSVLAKSPDKQNSISKRTEAAKLVKINWTKAFGFEPIVTLEGPGKTSLVQSLFN
jgi:hypothetical protein